MLVQGHKCRVLLVVVRSEKLESTNFNHSKQKHCSILLPFLLRIRRTSINVQVLVARVLSAFELLLKSYIVCVSSLPPCVSADPQVFQGFLTPEVCSLYLFQIEFHSLVFKRCDGCREIKELRGKLFSKERGRIM